MSENKETYEEGKMNGVDDFILDENDKKRRTNNKIVYILLVLIIVITISGALFLFFSLKENKNKNKIEENTNYKRNGELVTAFFKDGYVTKNYDNVMKYLADNYYDHSPAAARSNKDAVEILKWVPSVFSEVTIDILELTCQKDMVDTRILFNVVHTGEYNGIPATGKAISFEALENFKVVNGIIVESWGYWPDKQIEEKIRGSDNTKKNAELVTAFFKDGYVTKNYDNVMKYLADDYYDHSPAAARSNKDAVEILKWVPSVFSNITIEILDLTCENDMVATRILFNVVHTGEYNGIPATEKAISFEALETFKVIDGIIVESWGYWPDKQIEEKLKSQ